MANIRDCYNSLLLYWFSCLEYQKNLWQDTSILLFLYSYYSVLVYLKLQKLEEGDVKEIDLSSSLLGNGFQSVENGIVCEIPFGSLTGNGFLSNLGPVIPIKMSFLGQVSSNLRTKVTSYGINNLYLEVFVDVEVKERISLPRSSKDVTIHIEAPLSIKIISGSVPDYYGGIVGKNSETVFLEEKD